MTRLELSQQYCSYLDIIADMQNTRFSLKYSYYQGLIHGLGVALGYEYETVEQDIDRASGREPMPEQIRLAI